MPAFPKPFPVRALAAAAAAALALGVLLVWAIPGDPAGVRSALDGILRGRAGGAGAASGAETALSLTALLGEGSEGISGDTSGVPGPGFRKVAGPRPFAFPADHGPHPGYRSEWWYFTGTLADARGREYGYQLTFFRSGLRPPGADPGSGPDPRGRPDSGRSSPWAAADAYMAHFTVTDAEAGAFEAHERFSRAALGLAGAEAGAGRPFRVWVEDWRAVSLDTGFLPLRLRAAQGAIALDLVLGPGKPRVLQGDSGYSRKGPEPGNASLYYSYTRLPTRGRIRTARGEFTVTGTSWLDREWGSSLLSPGLAGWEWFGLRLADSTDWVFFRLRKAGPEAAAEDSVAFDYGLKVDAAGRTRALGPGEATARIQSRWRGSRGAAYPVRWRLSVPSEGLEMDVAPIVAGQELRLTIPYWEGMVVVRARREGREIPGRGYMELTGY